MKNLLLTFLYFLATTTQAQWQVIGTQIPSTTSGYNDGKVFFLNDSVGYGLFNKTTDGGISWQLTNGPLGGSDIFFSGELFGHRVHATMTGPPVYTRTLDGGNSWVDMSAALPTSAYGFYDVYFPSMDTGYISNEGRVFKTVDTGTTWVTKYQNTNFHTSSLCFPTNEIGYVPGYQTAAPYNNKILLTKNGGNTWTTVLLPFFYSEDLLVFAPDTNQVYLVARHKGKIYHSGDGGYNWNLQYSDSTIYLMDIFFPNKDVGYAAGYTYQNFANEGVLLKTIDGGNNWVNQMIGYPKILRDCHFISADIGWLAGSDGEVLHTTNGGGVLGIATPNILQNKINIYPNPATREINIQATVELIHAELTVYNSFGQVVRQVQNINGQSFTLHREGLANGVYFVQLVEDGRMIGGGRLVVGE